MSKNPRHPLEVGTLSKRLLGYFPHTPIRTWILSPLIKSENYTCTQVKNPSSSQRNTIKYTFGTVSVFIERWESDVWKVVFEKRFRNAAATVGATRGCPYGSARRIARAKLTVAVPIASAAAVADAAMLDYCVRK